MLVDCEVEFNVKRSIESWNSVNPGINMIETEEEFVMNIMKGAHRHYIEN
jgi:hypothetical protein